MHLFLKILGVAGMIFGSLVGILFLVILLVLFVPVFYRISGNNKDEKHHILGKVTWLFPAFAGKGGYEDGQLFYHFRIFGFYLMRYPDYKSSTSRRKPKTKPNPKTKTNPKTDSEKKNPEKSLIRDSDFEKEWEKETEKETEKKAEKNQIEKKEEQERTKEKEEKKNGLWKSFRQILSFLEEEENKLAFRKLKHTFIRLAKVLRPKKIKGCVLFGMDDPALTAQIVGIIAIIYGMIGYGIEIHPDFNGKRLDYEFEIAGHISVFSLICPLISLWKSGQLKVLKHNFENIMNEE